MNPTILDAKAELEDYGLEVKPSGERSLWIAATTRDTGDGLRVSNDASALLQQDDRWVAVFPAPGTLSYEVRGDLQDLLPLIRSVYTHYRRLGGAFKDAFRRSVPSSDTYLVGRFPAEDRSAPLPQSRRVEIGTDEGLRLRVEWSGTTTAWTASELSRGKTLLWIAGELVWGTYVGAKLIPTEQTWIDFLEHLAQMWSYLKWEEKYPLGLQPRVPSLLRSEAQTRWEMLEEDRSSEEEKAVTAFERRHDLAQGFAGAALPFVRLIREGNQVWLCSPHREVVRPLTEVLDQLSAIGDTIARRIASSAEPRAQAVTDWWQGHENGRPMELAEIATGLSAETIRWVVEATPSEGLELDAPSGEFQLTEVLAAARLMVGSLEPETVRAAITAIAGLPKVETEELDLLSEKAEGLLFHLGPKRPWAEGYTLAGWLRKVLGIESSRSVDPEELLKRLGVPVSEIEIQDDLLDALACWGRRHGPIVVLNRAGRHAQSLPGRRSTLAHELCHLLIDRQGALPLVEVLNGRAPWRVEARARAFAAELLLPRTRAEEVSRASADITCAVEELKAAYGVSHEIAIRQIENARPFLSSQQSAVLERMVSCLERF